MFWKTDSEADKAGCVHWLIRHAKTCMKAILPFPNVMRTKIGVEATGASKIAIALGPVARWRRQSVAVLMQGRGTQEADTRTQQGSQSGIYYCM